MHILVEFAKDYLVPGSIGLLVLGFLFGVVLLYGPAGVARWGRRWLTALALLYWLLSTPLVSDWLIGRLTSGVSVTSDPATLAGARAIVVLSTGGAAYRANGREIAELGRSSAMNVLEGVRLFEALGHPWVLVSGGKVEAGRQVPEAEVLQAALVRLGVPRDRILVDAVSQTTREQAEHCAVMLRSRRLEPAVLVSSPDHMPRALLAFREAGVSPLASASAFVSPPAGNLLERLKPSRSALLQSDWAMYEWIARAYYRVEGWTRSGTKSG